MSRLQMEGRRRGYAEAFLQQLIRLILTDSMTPGASCSKQRSPPVFQTHNSAPRHNTSKLLGKEFLQEDNLLTGQAALAARGRHLRSQPAASIGVWAFWTGSSFCFSILSVRGNLMAHAKWYTQETAGSFLQFLLLKSCFSLFPRKFQSLGSVVFFLLFFAFFAVFPFFLREPLSAYH